MDGQYSWKRTEDIEIDLADLLRRLCGQWKCILLCALTAAVVLGGCGWLWGKSASKTAAEAEEAELTEEEEQAVIDAVSLEKQIRELQTYLDNSILMQIDPYHKVKRIMLYSIDRAERKELARITESYLNFVSNGGAADKLAEYSSKWKIDKSYLAEVISSYQKTYTSPYQIAVDSMEDDSQMAESLFYVEVIGKDAETAEKLAQDMQTVLEEYSGRVEKIAGSHRLMLVSSMESVTADSGLQSQQNDKRNLLSSNSAGLKTAINTFSKKQMAVYKENAVEKEADKQEDLQKNTSDQGFLSDLKYVILGFLAGIFGYVCVFTYRYISSDTVKSIEEMKKQYAFQVYGEIPIWKNMKQNMSQSWLDLYEREKTRVASRIKLACQKQKIVRLCAVSDFSFQIHEEECLDGIAKQLKAWGISMETVENAAMDSGVWDKLTEYGNILMVCRMGTTTHRMIDEAMDFYLENGITVTGTVLFGGDEKNRT